ncbi:MAG: hypothetical protein PsegKO_24670 [Pseudohongiellaceae bacterium]
MPDRIEIRRIVDILQRIVAYAGKKVGKHSFASPVWTEQAPMFAALNDEFVGIKYGALTKTAARSLDFQ